MKTLYNIGIVLLMVYIIDGITVSYYKQKLTDHTYYKDLCIMYILNDKMAMKVMNIGLDEEFKKRNTNPIEAFYIKRSVKEAMLECGE